MINARLLSKPSIVFWIVKLNIIVFIFWIWSPLLGQNFMVDNFLVSWSGLRAGRIWTLVTSVFSHNLFFHIFLNMYAFLGFGTVLENALGKRKFLKFYLTAGIIASISHSLVSAFIMGKPDLAALGASGAVSGVVLLFSLMFPDEKILLLGIIPIPAIFAAVLIVGLDLWGLIEQVHGGSLPLGHGAHLGGAMYGAGYYVTNLRRRNKF